MNPATPSPEALDPRVRRFAHEATAEMTCAQAAEILGPSYCMRTVMRLCRHHQIECTAPINASGTTRADGTGHKMRWVISKAALLSYIIRSTHGPRDVLMQAIKQECPVWESFARHIASGGDAQELPENVIPIKGRKQQATRTAPPVNDPRQLDLFLTPPAKQSA